MNITLISFGSRGDLEPLVAIGNELIKRNHNVCLIANSEIENIASEYNIPVKLISLSVKDLLYEQGNELLKSESALKSLKIISNIILQNVSSIARQVFELAKDADYIIINERYYIIAQSLKDKYNIKIIQICFQPKGITQEYPYLYFRPWFFSFLSNRETHYFVDKMLLKKFLPKINKLRIENFDLPELKINELLKQKHRSLLLQGFSPQLFKKPDDWTKNLVICGNWYLNRTYTEISDELNHFLSIPKYKIYIGFGSMIYNSKKLIEILLKVISQIDVNFVLVQNWSDKSKISTGLFHENIYILKDCLHEDVFPKVDLIIHHGGSGTVNAAVRNSKPQLVAWFMLDQQFWATQVNKLNIGINLGTFHRLNFLKIINAIKKIQENENIKVKTEYIGIKIKNEDGSKNAVDFLDNYFWGYSI